MPQRWRKNEPCSYRNKQGHGKSAPTEIRHDFPAYGTICDKCGWQNYFAGVCRSKGKPTRPQQPTPPSGNTRETESAIFDSALQPASATSQATESTHLTTTSTATSLTIGSDSHPSPNHSSRLQQRPTLLLHSIGIQPPPPPHHG